VEVAESHTLDDLNWTISKIPSKEWIWLDFLIGIIFEGCPQALDENSWNAEQLWRKALSPWTPWFK
jgi:hypothetical protein